MFERGVAPPVVARKLRVSRKSAYAWHAAWRKGGTETSARRGRADGRPG
jgi:putative transposase